MYLDSLSKRVRSHCRMLVLFVQYSKNVCWHCFCRQIRTIFMRHPSSLPLCFVSVEMLALFTCSKICFLKCKNKYDNEKEAVYLPNVLKATTPRKSPLPESIALKLSQQLLINPENSEPSESSMAVSYCCCHKASYAVMLHQFMLHGVKKERAD